jgi:hypothetical protein
MYRTTQTASMSTPSMKINSSQLYRVLTEVLPSISFTIETKPNLYIMLTLNIPSEQIEQAFTDAIAKVLSPDNYNNPINDIVKKAVGTTYSKGALTEQIEAKIITKLNQFMETPEFDTLLGQAVAKAIADREIAKDPKKR